jgi:hypothetical protein
MKRWRRTLVLGAMLVGCAVASGAAIARGGHGGGHSGHAGSSGSHAGFPGGHGGHFSGGHRFAPRFHAGVFIGAAPFAPFYPPFSLYPPSSPDYYYGAPPADTPFWYFCVSANTYYPYVADCPEGWQQVVPEPAS